MKKVLILGAGLVSLPIVKYLTDLSDYHVTIVSKDPNSDLSKMIEGKSNCDFLVFDTAVEDEKLNGLIKNSDVVVSLLPYVLHPSIARKCIDLKTDMITASYVSPEMASFDKEAKEKGVLILNELGLDPGIDHMSAMKIIDDVHSEGGKILSFESFCGGLPAPEANDNPLGYKFSWSPEGVVRASGNSAKFLKDDEIVVIPGERLFKADFEVEVPGFGVFEAYPNRDSIPYGKVYGIEEAHTIFRGTFRNTGWCATWYNFMHLNLASHDKPVSKDWKTYFALTKSICGSEANDAAALKRDICARLDISEDDQTIVALQWLGYFSDAPLPSGKKTAFEVMVHTLSSLMEYKDGERDMIVLVHRFITESSDGKKHKVTSSMIDFGIPGGDSAMARTVSLPPAIAAKIVCEGKISLKGVQIPVAKEVYEPILAELERLNIVCTEEFSDL
jgi:saccharopine dehydrogenase-like NADP-dependent oxidoreductase